MLRKIALWIFICSMVGILSGTTSALFLWSLDLISNFRESNLYIIWGLPFVGIIVGYIYQRSTYEVQQGNNTIIWAYQNKKSTVPFLMAPIIFLTTLMTHLVGGSAGREGTAVQMSTSIAILFQSTFTSLRKFKKTLIQMGIASGFSGIFGTPLAGILFSVELFLSKKQNLHSLFPVIISSFLSHFICVYFWGIEHTEYHIFSDFKFTVGSAISMILAGIFFGLTARFFTFTTRLFSTIGHKLFSVLWLKAMCGGFILVLLYMMFDCSQYQGLGITTIERSFYLESDISVFFIKILLTTFTLSWGFKGGEVTPLFFVGATLGSALSGFLGIPIDLMAGFGFIAVFAAATHSPISSTVMGIELFGTEYTYCFLVISLIAHFVSGKVGIYGAQKSWMQKIKFENFICREVQG